MTVEPLEKEEITTPTIQPGPPQWDADQERKRAAYVAGRANAFLVAAIRIGYESLGKMVAESDELLAKRNPADAPTLTRDIISTASTALRVLAKEACIIANPDGSFRIEYNDAGVAAPAPQPATPTETQPT